MRETEFRGRDQTTGEWVYGDLVHDDSKNPMIQIYMESREAIGNIHVAHKVIPETAGEYTGLKDKNGVKIFEGDFLRVEAEIYRVGWDIDAAKFVLIPPTNNFVWRMDMDEWKADDVYEVTGNIHDSPELLKPEEEGNDEGMLTIEKMPNEGDGGLGDGFDNEDDDDGFDPDDPF